MSQVDGTLEIQQRFDQLAQGARRFVRALYVAAWNFIEDGGFNHCAAISYYALLSVIPFIVLLAAILAAILGSTESGLQEALAVVRRVVPEFSGELAGGVQRLVANSSTLGAVSVIFSLWTASLVFASVQRAVNHIFRVSEKPVWGTVKPRLIFLGSAMLLLVGFVLTNAMAVVQGFGVYLGGGLVDTLVSLSWVQLLLDLVLDVVVFSWLMAAMIPGRTGKATLIPTVVFATVGWEGAKRLFALYVRQASASFSFTGTAAAAIAFMFWVYFASLVVLLSFELAAVLRGDRSDWR